MKKFLFTTAALTVFASSTMAATPSKCASLKQELKAMQKAQTLIMQSLVNNHESFASSLEEYSAAVGVAPSQASKEMNKSAQAFRLRGVQAKRTANDLSAATNELIARVSNCL